MEVAAVSRRTMIITLPRKIFLIKLQITRNITIDLHYAVAALTDDSLLMESHFSVMFCFSKL